MPAACGSRLSQRANVLLFSANRPSRRSSCLPWRHGRRTPAGSAALAGGDGADLSLTGSARPVLASRPATDPLTSTSTGNHLPVGARAGRKANCAMWRRWGAAPGADQQPGPAKPSGAAHSAGKRQAGGTGKAGARPQGIATGGSGRPNRPLEPQDYPPSPPAQPRGPELWPQPAPAPAP